MVGLRILVGEVFNSTQSLVLEGVLELLLVIIVTLNLRFTICTIDILTEVEDLHSVSTLMTRILTLLRVAQLLSIRSYEWLVEIINCCSTCQTVSPVEVIERLLGVTSWVVGSLHSILQDELRELSPIGIVLHAVAEVELLSLSRIGDRQISLSVSNAEQDVTIEHYLTIVGLQQDLYQRLTTSSGGRAFLDSLLNLVNTQRLNATSNALIVSLSCVEASISEANITRVTSNVTSYLIVNQIELIVQVVVLFLTIVEAICGLELVSSPILSSNLTIAQVLLQYTYTNVLLQVDIVIVNGQVKSCTNVVIKSLLGRVPNEDLVVLRVPTLLITSYTTSCGSEERLVIVRLFLPDQTLQAQARRNQQCIVRGNLCIVNILQLQSNSVVSVSVSVGLIVLVFSIPYNIIVIP